jgi:hypothetical protein
MREPGSGLAGEFCAQKLGNALMPIGHGNLQPTNAKGLRLYANCQRRLQSPAKL